jgi:hypothetical protein
MNEQELKTYLNSKIIAHFECDKVEILQTDKGCLTGDDGNVVPVISYVNGYPKAEGIPLEQRRFIQHDTKDTAFEAALENFDPLSLNVRGDGDILKIFWRHDPMLERYPGKHLTASSKYTVYMRLAVLRSNKPSAVSENHD